MQLAIVASTFLALYATAYFRVHMKRRDLRIINRDDLRPHRTLQAPENACTLLFER
jgi:hypothetical protein